MSSLNPRHTTLLRVYETGCAVAFLLLAGGFAFLYYLGASTDWKPVALYTSGETLPEADRVLLSETSGWLAWRVPKEGAVCAMDFRRHGQVVCLRPVPSLEARPVDVIDGDLLVLRTSAEISFLETLQRGWFQVTGQEEALASSLQSGRSKRTLTTHLERLDSRTGHVRSSMAGLRSETPGQDRPLTDFETGKVALSPDRVTLAWWRAIEDVGLSPLSATVTETLDVLSAGPNFGKLFHRQFKSDGTLAIRSRLLEWIGQPLWFGPETCLVLSFLDSGSFVPFDCREGSVQATVPVSTLFQTMHESAPEVAFDPEGFHLIKGERESPVALFFWCQAVESAHFFLFDPLFHLISHHRLDSKDFVFSQTLWLEKSQTLLVASESKGQLIGLSPQGERRSSYPLPPDWLDGFKVLGEDAIGSLVGYNRGAFLRTAAGEAGWETMEFVR